MRITEKDGKTIAYLEGRIDTNNSQQIRKELFDAIGDKTENIVIDAEKLEYISSSGLRILMSLHKNIGKSFPVINVSRDVYDILDTTGFTDILDVERVYRSVSVDGCEVIGKGAYGTVYRIGPETIVKVYSSPESLSMIQNEKELARTALIAGIPTAIPYDIVRVGDSYGSVFELLNAKSFNDLLIDHPENADETIEKYARFLREVNSCTIPEGKLGSAKKKFLGYLETAGKYLDSTLYSRLETLLSEIPEMHNAVHGDAQMKNVMLRDGEPMLIDMDTLSVGHPIFDLQSVYVTYFAFGEDEPGHGMDFLGISDELTLKVWKDFMKYYFDTEDEKLISRLRDKISIVGCIRFLYLVDLISDHDSELFHTRVKHTVERLAGLANKTHSLLFDI